MALRAADDPKMPSHLRFAGLQRRTLRAYRLAVDRFLTYVRIHSLPLRRQADVDYAVSEFINAMYQEGDSLAQAGHLLSGMRLTLPTASQYFRNWQRVHRPVRAIPISWDLLQAMSGMCFTLGYHRVALLLYVGFFCFLRTSEMMSLQCMHLIPDRRSSRLTVIIPFAKTSAGNPQVLVFSDPVCILLRSPCCMHVKHRTSSGPLPQHNSVNFGFGLLKPVAFLLKITAPTEFEEVVPPGTF